MKKICLSSLLIISLIIALPIYAQVQSLSDRLNGFDLSKTLKPKEEILSGGPPRDGIPAILKPEFGTVEHGNWLKDDDLVAGIDFKGIRKAYPLKILVWHEAVNDEIGGTPILISYCPLCGSTLVFKRDFGEKTYTFGISGLLYQSDVLFYDHQTESLWSQLEMRAISGEMIGTEFEIFPSTLATWKEWKDAYPDTFVLSRETGFNRNYGIDPYVGYKNSSSIMFPIKHKSKKFHPKEKVLVVISGDVAKAYPFSELKKVRSPLKDHVGDKDVIIQFRNGEYVQASDNSGKITESFVTYWFAWYTFRPDTLVYKD